MRAVEFEDVCERSGCFGIKWPRKAPRHEVEIRYFGLFLDGIGPKWGTPWSLVSRSGKGPTKGP